MTKGFTRHLLGVRANPEQVYQAVFQDAQHLVWLDEHGDRGRGVSYLAEGIPLELSDNGQDLLRSLHTDIALSEGQDLRGVPLGIHLALPYEWGVLNLGVTPPPGSPVIPQGLLVERLVECDHATGAVTVVSLGREPIEDLLLWIDRIERALESPTKPAEPVLEPVRSVQWRDPESRYAEMIESAQASIAKGDAYQLCLTTSVTLEGEVDLLSLHRVMRKTNPTHHQAFLRFSGLTMVSASPETFLQVSVDGDVTTRPIKGTRPRGLTVSEDSELVRELLESEKERAENLMIVDLMRNDLSKVCDTGSVAVPELLVVESYATVHQLVSTVTGRVQQSLDVLDVVKAAFPAGSMTGAPKKRAVEILQELEGAPRGFYSGTYGVWRADRSAVFAMTIRTALEVDGALTLGVGGGITAGSETKNEILEVGIKAQAFLRALGANQVGYS